MCCCASFLSSVISQSTPAGEQPASRARSSGQSTAPGGGPLPAPEILRAVLHHLGPIWPARLEARELSPFAHQLEQEVGVAHVDDAVQDTRRRVVFSFGRAPVGLSEIGRAHV